MLQYRTVNPRTLELLKKLMVLNELQDFFLVGGTALALQLGHRVSIDLDLFTQRDFDTKNLSFKLEKEFETSDIIEEKNTLNLNIIHPKKSNNIIKIDLIKYSYPLLNPILEIEGIRMLSVEDIIPMKLSAIAGRGSKKDFYDIFYLLKSYSFEEMVGLFKKKFPNTNEFHVLKSLSYFEDAEIEPNPKMTERTYWKTVKSKIADETNKYLKK